MKKIFFLILIPTISVAQSSRGGIGYDSGGGDITLGAFLAIGTAIVIMLIGIGGAIGEAGKDKLQDLKDKKIEKKINRGKSEVMEELRKNPAVSSKTKEENRKDAVRSIQRKRLKAFKDPWWKL